MCESTVSGLEYSAVMPAPTIQIFGVKKCAESRKAERWFKERSVQISYIDLGTRGLSPGELRSVSAKVGIEALIDRQGTRYRDRGLRAAAPTGPRIEQALLLDPLLLRTPIVRASNNGKVLATIGFAPDQWQTWLEPAP